MQPFSTSPRDARALGVYARASALSWVARMGWAPGLVVDAVGYLGGKSRGLAKALHDAGLLRAQQWEASAHVKGYYTITHQGLDVLEEMFDRAQDAARSFGYPEIKAAPQKIPTFKSGIAVHDLFVQMLSAIALIDTSHGKAVGYKTTAEMAGMRKIPDCMIERTGGKV
ncbi:MAG: hypothetical protein LWW81_11395, partial [Rhodocyclales bacterium]|nr:hypothetical protein [Rhodocyclales bacterium]